MQLPVTCAIIRELSQPNKFGERYRIDFHRYRDGKIDAFLMAYEIESLERATAMLRGDTWVRDQYEVVKIIEMTENEVIPGHEVPVLKHLTPTYHTYQLDIQQFEGYLNTWLRNEKGVDVTIQVHGEDGGGYGYFGVTIPDEAKEIFKTWYDIDERYIEYEVIEPLMRDIFQCDSIEYEYHLERECLLVYKPIK